MLSNNQVHPSQVDSSRSPSAPARDEHVAPPQYPTEAAGHPMTSFPVAPAVGGGDHHTVSGPGTSTVPPDQALSHHNPPNYEACLPTGHKTHPSYTVIPPSSLYQTGQPQQPLQHHDHRHYPPPPPPYGVVTQHQHQSVTIIGQTPRPYPSPEPSANYGCAVVLSCCVLWCCGCIFGLVAFILAVAAINDAPTSARRARKLVAASYTVSGIGIAVPVIVIVITSVVLAGASDKRRPYCSTFEYSVDGNCYTYRSGLFSYQLCARYLGGRFTDGYCYYNHRNYRSVHEDLHS